MRCFQILALCLLGIGSQLASASLVSDLSALGLSPGTKIGSPSDPAFTQRWSSYNAPDYVVAVKPVTEKDVAKIVRMHSKRRLSIA